jgi:septum formation protein
MTQSHARLILASASPRRRDLLAQAGYEFEVVAPNVAELTEPNLSLRELTTANATRKALAVARARPGAIVLGADTLVLLEGAIIGKPANIEQAGAILRQLSGRIHEVCTAVFIATPRGRFRSFAAISRVTFRKLSESAIEDYILKINALDKAGAYAAQGAGRDIIATIEGSVTNVVGLPMERTIDALTRFNILPRHL